MARERGGCTEVDREGVAGGERRGRERLRGLLNKDFALIQPNPCKAQRGLTSDGRLSFHAETNVLERRYLIVEFDDAKNWNDSDVLDSQAARLLHLRLYLPLVLVVFSGNKSLQGWFVCGNHSKDDLKTFFTGAVKFGADRRLWLASQFCRMPDGWREWHDEKGECSLRLQSVYYFAPETLRAARE